ncbi:MAG: hypothetical protein ACPG4M_01405 [Alphaproteobacteria bacterium]
MTDSGSKPRLRAGKPSEVNMGREYDETSPSQSAAAVIGERAMAYAQALPQGQRMVVHVVGHPLPFLMVRISATSTEHVLIEGTDDNGQPVEIIAKPEALVISFSAASVS